MAVNDLFRFRPQSLAHAIELGIGLGEQLPISEQVPKIVIRYLGGKECIGAFLALAIALVIMDASVRIVAIIGLAVIRRVDRSGVGPLLAMRTPNKCWPH